MGSTSKELKDFCKVSIQPGETKTVTFHLTPKQLATWNESTHQWQMPGGKYKAYVCASSADIRGNLMFNVK